MTRDRGLVDGVGKRVYQCPGCFSLTYWKPSKDPGATFECECGERLTRIDLRDPEPSPGVVFESPLALTDSIAAALEDDDSYVYDDYGNRYPDAAYIVARVLERDT